CARFLAHHRRTVYLNFRPSDYDLLHTVYVRYLRSSQRANLADFFLLQVHYRRHTARLNYGGLLHEPSPELDQFERGFQVDSSRSIQCAVLSQTVPAGGGGVDFMQPKNDQARQIYNSYRRLYVLSKDE